MLTTLESDQLADAIGRRREFIDGFRRNHRGNLSRRWNGMILTVFKQPEGTYSWCMAKGGDTVFGPCFFTETQALSSLWRETQDREEMTWKA